jgi:hypothetical protein
MLTLMYSRLHVEVAAWADTYAALFANFAPTPNCVCHVQPVRAEQPSEFGALARQGRVTGYPAIIIELPSSSRACSSAS